MTSGNNMNQVLLYCRRKSVHPIADQTVTLLAEQLELSGHHVDITHSLNIPRLILNSYQTVHLILESLPLTANEALHFGICKALGKATVISVLNSDRNIKKAFLNFVQPDAFSVSQTDHLKWYRNITANKFVLPAFPKAQNNYRNSQFKFDSLLVPLSSKIEEALSIKFEGTVYFDGRRLLQNQNSLSLRKRWSELQASGKLSSDAHLIMSENKLAELLDEQQIAVVLAGNHLSNTEFTEWLNLILNRGNLILLNEYQATGFPGFWTSGYNCIVLPTKTWAVNLAHIDFQQKLSSTCCKPNELFEPVANELARLYSKLTQQKTSLLTSRSVKL